MKPSPRYDFPVAITAASAEMPAELADIVAGLYSVHLNHTISIDVVPEFSRREPWPPAPPEDVDTPRSTDEARRNAIRMAEYAITPDSTLAGRVERLDVPDGAIVFFLAPAEFEAINVECASLKAMSSGLHDAVPVSTLAQSHPHLARFLIERFASSRYLSDYDRWLLDRTSEKT